MALAVALLIPASASAGDRAVVGTDKMREAEKQLLSDINRIRVRNGRARLRSDKPTSQVARARSVDMAAKRYFAHVEPDGDNADRILRRRDVRASEVLENIGHTQGYSLKRGANNMATWWYNSPPHRTQMLARDVNYVGIGVARRGSRFTYTAIFTRSPDKTAPEVVIDKVKASRDGTVTIDWHGVDPKLAKGTAGIRGFDVHRFAGVGTWDRIDHAGRASRLSLQAPDRGTQVFRIRAVDKAGNVGPWSYTRVDPADARPRLAANVGRPRALVQRINAA